MTLEFGWVTHYQLHKIVMIPGYEDASNTPMKNLRAYIPSGVLATAMRPVITPQAISSDGSQIFGLIRVRMSCEGMRKRAYPTR